MQNSINVRAASSEDKDAILAFCQNTFSWGDYIPSVFDRWVQDRANKFLVATVDQKPVGILHVSFLGNGIAWMEGIRVHPEFRRQKIGSTLDVEARRVSRENGCGVARLATSVKNIAAQKTLDTEGYHRVAQFKEWETEPESMEGAAWRVASEKDFSAILARWQSSEMRQASHTIMPNRRWQWTELDERRLHEHIAANEVRIAADGFGLVLASDEEDWNGVSIQALVGNDETVFDLARAVRAEAAYRGYSYVEAILADHAPLNAALERAGYRSDGGMFIYEQQL